MSRLLDFVTPQTASVVRRHAARLGATVRPREGHIELVDADGLILTELHPDTDGHWVLASWNGKAYVAQDPPGAIEPGVVYRYTYARSLRALRRRGSPAFTSAAQALATVGAS